MPDFGGGEGPAHAYIIKNWKRIVGTTTAEAATKPLLDLPTSHMVPPAFHGASSALGHLWGWLHAIAVRGGGKVCKLAFQAKALDMGIANQISCNDGDCRLSEEPQRILSRSAVEPAVAGSVWADGSAYAKMAELPCIKEVRSRVWEEGVRGEGRLSKVL